MCLWKDGILLVLFGSYLPVLTGEDVSSVKVEAAAVCCTIANINCGNSSNFGRERRSVGHLLQRIAIIEKSNKKVWRQEMSKSRRKRQTDKEKLVNQLRSSLMEFESCICSTNSTSNTCQMLFPSDILKPNISSNFLAAFEQVSSMKQFDCTVTSASAISCTLKVSAQHRDNSDGTVLGMTGGKVPAPNQDCLACIPLYCTFHVFKTSLDGPNITFHEKYSYCSRQEEDLMSRAVKKTSLQLATSAETTTFSSVAAVRPSSFPLRDLETPRVRLLGETNHIVHPTTVNPQVMFPDFGRAGIWTGLGISAGTRQLRPPRRQNTHTVDHNMGGQYLILAGAVVGGIVLGAVIMALVVYGLLRKKILNKINEMRCSTRCPNVCQEQGPHCATSSQDPVPIARVTPMTVRPRSVITPLNTKVHSTRIPSSQVAPVQSSSSSSNRWETSDYSGTYSYIADNDQHFLDLCDQAMTGRESEAAPDADYHLAHYEIPQTRPAATIIRRAGSLPVIYHSPDETLWFAGYRWNSNKLLTDLPEVENEYMEIKPDPIPEHGADTQHQNDKIGRVGSSVSLT